MKYLSIDAGGTYIKYAWLDENGTILEQGKQETPYASKEAFFEVIKQLWLSCDETKGGICMSLPGTINCDTGFVHQGGSLTYHHGVNIKEWYEKELNTKVEIENDARCAALAEMNSGEMKNIQNGIVLTFGTGVGGCFIINGEIYKGTHLFSGEVSVLVCDDIKKKGMDAVLGHIAGIGHLAKRVCEAKQVPLEEGKTIFEWIKHQDPTALKFFQEYCEFFPVWFEFYGSFSGRINRNREDLSVFCTFNRRCRNFSELFCLVKICKYLLIWRCKVVEFQFYFVFCFRN